MTRKVITTCIALLVAGLHFFKGCIFQGQFHVFVQSYMIDVFLPMTLFLLMGLIPNKIIGSAFFRAVSIVGFGCFVETSQYLGYPIFGSTFDPLDIVAYTVGVALGALLDLVIFPRLIPHWKEA